MYLTYKKKQTFLIISVVHSLACCLNLFRFVEMAVHNACFHLASCKISMLLFWCYNWRMGYFISWNILTMQLQKDFSELPNMYTDWDKDCGRRRQTMTTCSPGTRGWLLDWVPGDRLYLAQTKCNKCQFHIRKISLSPN